MGRTALAPENRRSETIQVTALPSEAAHVKAAADREMVSVSAYVRRLIVRDMRD